jgi:alpha/beta superfamily hydrolase
VPGPLPLSARWRRVPRHVVGLAGLALAAACAGGGGAGSGGAPDGAGSGAGPGRFQPHAFRPGEILAYELRDPKGLALGRVHSSFLRSEDGFAQFLTRVQQADGEAIEHVTVLRGDATPVRYKRLSSRTGRLALDFRDDEIRVFDGAEARQVLARTVNGAVMPADDLMVLAYVLSVEKPSAGDVRKIDVFDPVALERKVWSLSAQLDLDGHPVVELPHGRAVLDADGLVARFEHRDGRVLVPEIPPKPAPVVEYAPAWAYDRPAGARWSDREVKIVVKDGVLAGLLSVPDGDVVRRRWGRAHPPVVVYVGEGGGDRHGVAGPVHRGTWELFDHLADQGFAVLRLDERGVGASKGAADPALALEDTIAVLRWLERQEDVDPERRVLVGHGGGGLIAAAAARQLPVLALALMATPLPKTSTGLDFETILRETAVPTAVLQGLKDVDVSWKEDANGILDRLRRGKLGRDGPKQFFYERVDHLMKTEPKTSGPDRYRDATRRLDPQVLADLSGFLVGATR